MDHDKTYYRVRFSAGLNGSNETVYSIGNIQKRKALPSNGSSADSGAHKDGKVPSKIKSTTIENKRQEGDIKFSLKDSFSETLTKKDQDYLKAIVVGDVEGAKKTTKSAKAVENITVNDYNSSIKYSMKHDRPKLTNAEWTLLNNGLEIEIHNDENFIDEYTKWLYASKNGTRVFSIYGIGWGNDATPLLAVGGSKADAYRNAIQKIWRHKTMALTEVEQILIDALALCPLTKGKQAIIYLILETEEQKLEMARFIIKNEQATEKELMLAAQRIAEM